MRTLRSTSIFENIFYYVAVNKKNRIKWLKSWIYHVIQCALLKFQILIQGEFYVILFLLLCCLFEVLCNLAYILLVNWGIGKLTYYRWENLFKWLNRVLTYLYVFIIFCFRIKFEVTSSRVLFFSTTFLFHFKFINARSTLKLSALMYLTFVLFRFFKYNQFYMRTSSIFLFCWLFTNWFLQILVTLDSFLLSKGISSNLMDFFYFYTKTSQFCANLNEKKIKQLLKYFKAP